ISKSTDPVRLSHQNAVGTTTRRNFSVAYHCTKKREKNTRLPSQPTTFQALQSIPSSLPSCQRRPVGQSITRAAYGRATKRQRPCRGTSRSLAEDRLEDPVRLANVLGPPPAGHQREDLLGVLARHRRRLVGAHVGQLAQRDLQRHRYVVEAVDGDRLLAALDLTDELAGQAGAITEPLLTESALLAERPQPLPQELPYVFHRAFAHGWLP